MSVATGPGATTLHGDAARAELAGDRAGEADQAGLRRGVVRLPGRAEQADDRRHEDDATLAGTQHALRGALGDPEGGGEVGVDDGGEVVLAHPQQQAVVGDAGVRHEDLDRPELRLDRG